MPQFSGVLAEGLGFFTTYLKIILLSTRIYKFQKNIMHIKRQNYKNSRTCYNDLADEFYFL